MVLERKLADYIHQNQDRFVKDIVRLASLPSVSARNEGIEECAELVKKMIEEIGGNARLIRMDGVAPLVYGEIKSSRSKKTILFYNHYDVQPEDPVELWKSSPFKPEIRGGRLYGRGVSDDKGEFVARLKMLESYVKVSGEPPCNVKFCLEGEEEVGSPHLDDYVRKNSELFRADAVLWEYGHADEADRPIVSLGVKGMIYVELAIKSLSLDAHSMYAAALPSSPWRMVRLLNMIKDESERILIPGWYDNVQNLTEDELKVLEQQPFDANEFKRTFGAREFAGKMTDLQAKKALVSRPTANIAGVWGGYTGEGSKTVLPSAARCKIDFRLVPNQDPYELLEKLKKFLRDRGFADVEVVSSTMEPAARTSYRDPWASAAIKAGEEVYGMKSVIELSSPGTGPLYVFTKRYGVPSLDIGVSPHDAALHAPNENIRLDLLEKGMVWIAQTIENYLSGVR
jgi:acetylornithine deacetylase/succinyl-diaminopimelate desuccinylase-like protein